MKCGRRRLFVLVLVIEGDWGPITRTRTTTRRKGPSSVSPGARMERSIGDSEASEQFLRVGLDLRRGLLRRQNLGETTLDTVGSWASEFAKAEEAAGIGADDGQELLLLPGARFAHEDDNFPAKAEVPAHHPH